MRHILFLKAVTTHFSLPCYECIHPSISFPNALIRYSKLKLKLNVFSEQQKRTKLKLINIS
jgi:hypothetical protein